MGRGLLSQVQCSEIDSLDLFNEDEPSKVESTYTLDLTSTMVSSWDKKVYSFKGTLSTTLLGSLFEELEI